MRTPATKNTILALFFACTTLFFTPVFAVTMSPGPKQQASEAKPQPSIQVKETDYNFGEIMEGTPEVEHEFTVINKGKEVLKIERVRVD